MRRRCSRWLVLAAAGASLLAACGDEGSDEPSATEAAPASSTAAATEASTAADTGTGSRHVEIDGRSVHLDCRGEGFPVVILDAGLGVLPATTWAGVHDRLASSTTTCSYDRAGVGLSAPGPKPRTAGRMARELDALLVAAGLEPPYVLVGASFGAFVDELYAFRHPDRVAGMVLVDGLHPDLDTRIAPILGPQGTAARKRALADNVEGVRFADILKSDAQVRAARPLPKVPLVVLKHGISFDPGGEPLPPLERLWTRLQRANAKLSPKGRLVVAKQSHHRIAEDEPDVVVAAVESVLDAVAGD